VRFFLIIIIISSNLPSASLRYAFHVVFMEKVVKPITTSTSDEDKFLVENNFSNVIENNREHLEPIEAEDADDGRRNRPFV